MAILDKKYYDYYRLKKHKPIMTYDDIEIGTTYHIPPTILYDRRDFICETKDAYRATGKMLSSDGIWRQATIYPSEISVIFLVKKRTINKH